MSEQSVAYITGLNPRENTGIVSKVLLGEIYQLMQDLAEGYEPNPRQSLLVAEIERALIREEQEVQIRFTLPEHPEL